MYKMITLGAAALLSSSISTAFAAEVNCNTGLTRIGRKAAERAIAEHKKDACSGLKTKILGMTAGTDETDKLELKDYRLCEAGPIVTAVLSVHVQCSTGGGAALHTSVADDLTATASANLDTCQIIDLKVSGGSAIVQAGLDISHAASKIREGAQSQITPYCK